MHDCENLISRLLSKFSTKFLLLKKRKKPAPKKTFHLIFVWNFEIYFLLRQNSFDRLIAWTQTCFRMMNNKQHKHALTLKLNKTRPNWAYLERKKKIKKMNSHLKSHRAIWITLACWWSTNKVIDLMTTNQINGF